MTTIWCPSILDTPPGNVALPTFHKSSTTPSPVSGFGFERPFQGHTNDWLTPPALVGHLGHFDLDPCGCPLSTWTTASTTYFLPEHDGLSEPWFGRVFCNPPYGRAVQKWAQRMAEHMNGILLIFGRTDTTSWQQEIFPNADGLLFLDGRVRFRRPSGARGKSGTAPSVLLAYGANNVEALRNCGIAGAFIAKMEMRTGVKGSTL